MKFKTGDEARVKRTNKETMYKHIEGTTVLILNNVCGDLYKVIDCVGGQWVLDEEMLEPTTSEWHNPMRLTFKNGSSIEAIPNEDAIRSKEPELVWIDKIALPTATETKEMVERVRQEILKFTNAFPKEDKKLKFTFYVTEGYRIDKSNNTKIPTMTTEVLVNGKDYQYGGSATCDKTDYEEREGVLNAIANAVCGGNFDREFNKVMKNKAFANKKAHTCIYCGRVFDTVEEKQEHEAWHIERRKARRERYLLRKRAKEIAFEEAAQKMAKEMMGEQK